MAAPLSWVVVAWSMIAAASLTLASIHVVVWLRQRTDYGHLLFFAFAMSAAVFACFELLLMRAATPEAYAETLKWAHVPLATFVVSAVGFVHFYLGTGRAWLAYTTCALRVAALALDFTTGVNVNFLEVTALHRLSMWGGDTVAVPVGVVNPCVIVPQLANLTLLVYIVDAAIGLWRRGGAVARRRAMLVGGSLVVCVGLAAATATMMLAFAVRMPTLVAPGMLVVVLAMGYELVNDVLAAARLTSELRAKEAALRENERRMQLAAAAASLGMWEWDIARDELWMTDEGRALFGFRRDEPLALQAMLERIHAADRESARRQMTDASASEDFATEHGYRIPLPAGGVRWMLSRRQVERDAAGRPLKVRGVTLDVTARRQAEERFRAVVAAVPSAILLVDDRGTIHLANAQVETVFGYVPDELVGERVDRLVPARHAARHAEHRDAFMKDSRPRAMGAGRELFGRRKDGSEVPIEVGLNPLVASEEPLVLVTVVDVSERRRIEREAAKQRNELAHLSRVATLGALSGSLAHELNQPLAAILSNAQAAQRFLAQREPRLDQVKEILADIVKSDHRAAAVIQRLRALLKRDDVRHEPLDVNEVVEDVLRLMHSDLLHRRVEIAVDLAAGLPPVAADRVQIQQVLVNFVVNGCDAMEDVRGPRRLVVRTLRNGAGDVEIAVSDGGHGIPPADLERVFDPFVTTKRHGLGLGLAICRSIVEAHGGRIRATNNAAAGATLHLELPALQLAGAVHDALADGLRR